MIFHDSTQNFFFSKHPKKLNLLAWMTLKSSVVIFQALEALQPQWSQQPQQPRWPQWPWKPHFIKKITDPDGLIIPGTKMTNTCCFLKNGSSKIQFFTNIWQPFCLRLLRLFLKLVHKTQMVKPPKPTNHLDSRKNWSFYPSEPFTLDRYTMRHPVVWSYCLQKWTFPFVWFSLTFSDLLYKE